MELKIKLSLIVFTKNVRYYNAKFAFAYYYFVIVHPACDILTLFSEAELEESCLDLHQLATFPEILIQPIIGDLTLTSLLKDIKEVVCKDHQNLLKFASNLENADTTYKEIGEKIREEYCKHFYHTLIF